MASAMTDEKDFFKVESPCFADTRGVPSEADCFSARLHGPRNLVLAPRLILSPPRGAVPLRSVFPQRLLDGVRRIEENALDRSVGELGEKLKTIHVVLRIVPFVGIVANLRDAVPSGERVRPCAVHLGAEKPRYRLQAKGVPIGHFPSAMKFYSRIPLFNNQAAFVLFRVAKRCRAPVKL